VEVDGDALALLEPIAPDGGEGYAARSVLMAEFDALIVDLRLP